MLRKSIIISVSLVTLLLSVNSAHAQKVSFTPNAGVSKIVGSGGDLWNLGFSVAANLFVSTGKIVSLGGRFAYSSMSTAGKGILTEGEDPPLDYEDISTTGSFSIYEIVPSIQIATSSLDDNRDVRLAFQVGGGLFVLNKSDVSARGTYYSPFGGSMTKTVDLVDISDTHLGVRLGLDLSLKRKLMVQPLFGVIFLEGDSTAHASLCIGYIFGR